MINPRLFLSAATSEFGSARRLMAATVRSLGYEPVSVEDFPSGHGELRQWLREQIDSCHGLVQLIGESYGEEAPEPDPTFGRVSYTQFELLYARSIGKKTWLIVASNDFPRDRCVDELDVPEHADGEGACAHQAERRALQKLYLERLAQENHLRHTADSPEELELVVRRLHDEFRALRARETRRQRRTHAMLAAILLGVAVLGVGGYWGFNELFYRVEVAGPVTTERLRAQLDEDTQAARLRELAEADTETNWERRQDRRDEINAAYDEKISQMVDRFAEVQGRGTATRTLAEARRILAEEGLEEAIAYLSSHRARVFDRIREREDEARDRNRADLEIVLREADLHDTNGDDDEARAVYDRVLALEPDWDEALEAAAWFHLDQGRGAGSLPEKEQEYRHASDLARRLVAIDSESADGSRLLSVALNRLGDVAVKRGDLSLALELYGEDLRIAKRLAARDPTNQRWQLDLAATHEDLGGVAVAQGQLPLAAERYHSAHQIYVQLAASDAASGARQFDLAGSYLDVGQVAQSGGKDAEALNAFREARDIVKRLLDGEPGNVSWKHRLAAAYNSIGVIQEFRGAFEDATMTFQASREIVESLAKAAPDDVTVQQNLATVYGQLASESIRREDWAAAQQLTEDAIEINQRLFESDPSNTQMQGKLAEAYNTLGALANAQGNLQDLEASQRGYVEIMEVLATLDPSNTEWQSDLARGHGNLAIAYARQQKFESAKQAWESSLEVRKRLVDEFPENAEYANSLSINYWNLASMEQNRGRNDGALPYWKGAYEVLRDMEKRGFALTYDAARRLNTLQGVFRQ